MVVGDGFEYHFFHDLEFCCSKWLYSNYIWIYISPVFEFLWLEFRSSLGAPPKSLRTIVHLYPGRFLCVNPAMPYE
jgi:hypothetical protein